MARNVYVACHFFCLFTLLYFKTINVPRDDEGKTKGEWTAQHSPLSLIHLCLALRVAEPYCLVRFQNAIPASSITATNDDRVIEIVSFSKSILLLRHCYSITQ